MEQAFSDILSAAILRYNDGDYAQSLRLLELCLRVNPLHTRTRAWKLAAEYKIGRHSEYLDGVRSSINIVRLQSSRRLPDEFDSTALIDETISSVPLQTIEINMPIKNGEKHGDIFMHSDKGRSMSLFQDTMTNLILESLLSRSDGDAVRRYCDILGVKAWLNVLRNGGAIGPHYHTQAVESAVYYPAYKTGAGEIASGGGLIRFGVFPKQMGISEEIDSIDIQPEPDMVILFPAYLGHGVTAYTGIQPRYSIAVDVLARFITNE